MKEVWKQIDGFNSRYFISSRGNVKSIDTLVNTTNGSKRLFKGCNKKTRLDSNGRYVLVDLSCDGKSKTMLVHRLVAAAFLGDISGVEVNHKNGITNDNNVENLEIATRSENERHKYSQLGYKGTSMGKAGSLHKCSKAVEQLNSVTGEVIAKFGSNREAERITGTKSSCITLCCQGKQKKSNGYMWRYS